ncbi:MAG: Carbohydrate binding domain [Chloroflexota bacterium]|nr:Carbohydrate binding domain [Chloroflexota bacterium]
MPSVESHGGQRADDGRLAAGVTEPIIRPDEPAHRQPGGGLAAVVAPEGVAAILAIALVGVLLTARLAGLGGTGRTPTPGPSDGSSPGQTVAGPAVDLVSIGLVLGVDRRLLDYGQTLQTEIDKSTVDTVNVKATMGQMNQQLLAGAPAAARLQDSPPTAAVGRDLSAVYAQLRTKIDEANDFKNSDEPAWRASAIAVVELLKALAPIDLRLERLQAGLSDPAVETSPSAPPSAPPTSPPSPTATPAPTAPPSAPPSSGSTTPPSGTPTPSGTPPLAEPNQLQNPGFEAGIDPWELVLANPNVHAGVAADTAGPKSGKTSARIDISAFDGNPQSISLQQTGVTLEQGAKYRVSIALRSSIDREVRVRVTSASPPAQTYGRQTLLVGGTWTVQTFEFTTAVGGSGRLFTIEVGQAGGSVWIDDVSIARVSPFGP